MAVRTGLDVLAADGFARLKGRRVGLVTHPAAVDHRLRAAADLIAGTGLLTALYGPEHGLTGFAQDLEHVTDAGASSGVKVFSLYGDTIHSLRPTPEMLDDLELLIVDLVDIGSRYYTFQATMHYCVEAAADLGLSVMVLDRPNPIGGVAVEGPTIRPGYESFVGCYPIATRHGLTIGELARFYAGERKIDVDLEIVPLLGWTRDATAPIGGVPWVLPSPNLPTPDTALVYPGMCLIEGTNVSEGRGTTRPFEIVAAPGVKPEQLAKELNSAGLPGVYFRPMEVKPTFQKHAGRVCGGVQLHVLDPVAFRPVRTGLAVTAALRRHAPEFAWRTEEYEFVRDPIAIDLLFGSDRERLSIEAGADWREIAAAWEAEEASFAERRLPYLLY